MRTDMCINIRIDVCIDMCTDMRTDECEDMFEHLCIKMGRASLEGPYRDDAREPIQQ